MLSKFMGSAATLISLTLLLMQGCSETGTDQLTGSLGESQPPSEPVIALSDELQVNRFLWGQDLNVASSSNERLVVAFIDTGLKQESASGCSECHVYNSDGEPILGRNQKDATGHGTAMVETLRSILPVERMRSQVSLRIYSLAPTRGDAITGSEMQAAFRDAVLNKASIISVSLGTQTPNEKLRALVAQAARLGIVTLGSAGFDPEEIVLFPASYPGAIPVYGHSHEHEADEPFTASHAKIARLGESFVGWFTYPHYTGETTGAVPSFERSGDSSYATASFAAMLAGVHLRSTDACLSPRSAAAFGASLDGHQHSAGPLLADADLCTFE